MSEKFEAKNIREVCALLATDPDRGLSEKEAAKRHETGGPNELKETKKKSALESFLEQLNNPLIFILFVAAAISMLLGEVSDTAIILAVILVNALVGVIQEGRAQKALDALKQLTSPAALVRRGGRQVEIPARDLIPGDIVCLDAGRQVPADLELISVNSLKIQKEAEERRRAEEIKAIKELAAKIDKTTVEVTIKCGENGKVFGSVTSKEIASKLADMGYEIDKKKIVLKDSLKTVGDYPAEIRFMEGVSAKITVSVKPA